MSICCVISHAEQGKPLRLLDAARSRANVRVERFCERAPEDMHARSILAAVCGRMGQIAKGTG